MDFVPRNGCKVVMLMMACLLVSALSAKASIASSLAMDNAASTLLMEGKRVTSATPDKLTQYVIAVKNGDVEKRKTLIVYYYFEIGCGGKNRNRKPSELVSNGLINAQYDEQFRKYGVVETFTKVLADAYSLVLDRPPSKSDCDKWYKS